MARELCIGVVPEFSGKDWPLPGEEEQGPTFRQVADLIRGKQRPAGMLFAIGQASFLAIQVAACRFEDDGALAEQIGDQAGGVVVIDAKNLQDTRVAQEGAGALTVDVAELVDVLEDGPELDAVACHQPHCPFDGRQVTKRREFIEEVQHTDARRGQRPNDVLQALRDHQTQPARVGGQPVWR